MDGKNRRQHVEFTPKAGEIQAIVAVWRN
jgi:hypothetical protein